MSQQNPFGPNDRQQPDGGSSPSSPLPSYGSQTPSYGGGSSPSSPSPSGPVELGKPSTDSQQPPPYSGSAPSASPYQGSAPGAYTSPAGAYGGGYPAAGYGPPARQTSTLAIVSLVCGVLGLVTGFTWIVAIICGHLSLSEIRKSGGRLEGESMAKWGMGLGYLVLALGVLFLIGFILLMVIVGTSSTTG